MTSVKAQSGLSLWGWLYVLMITFVIVAAGIKSFPPIMNDVDIHGIMKKVAQDPKSATATPAEIRYAIALYLASGYATTVRPEDVKIKANPKGGRVMEVHYQRPVSLFSRGDYSLDLVWTFHHRVEIRQPN